MGQAELLTAGLLMAVAGLSALARHLSVPYLIVLVIGPKPPARVFCGEPAARENVPPLVCGIRHGPEQSA